MEWCSASCKPTSWELCLLLTLTCHSGLSGEICSEWCSIYYMSTILCSCQDHQVEVRRATQDVICQKTSGKRNVLWTFSKTDTGEEVYPNLKVGFFQELYVAVQWGKYVYIITPTVQNYISFDIWNRKPQCIKAPFTWTFWSGLPVIFCPFTSAYL